MFSSSRAIVCQNNSIYAVFLIPLTDLTIVITTIIELNVNIIVKIDALFLLKTGTLCFAFSYLGQIYRAICLVQTLIFLAKEFCDDDGQCEFLCEGVYC